MADVIDPADVSFDAIKADIIAYIEAKPDSASWQDFYDSGAGTTLIELIAGFATYLQFSIVASRRETYIAHAQQRSSMAAIAETLGYSMSRGANVKLNLTITPSSTVLISKFDIIGSYGEYDVIALEDYAFTDTVQQTDILVVIGNLKTESITMESDDITILRFISPNVSNDIRFTLNDSEIPHSNNMFDLLNDEYLAISNAVGAVDVMYLNKGGYTQTIGGVITEATVTYPYTTGDILTLQYIELAEFTWESASLVFDYGTVDNLGSALSSQYIAPESLDITRVLAPLRHETNGVVKGRADYRKLLQIEANVLVGDIVDTNATDISPAVVNLTYVKDDMTLLTTDQKTELLDTLDNYRPFGVSMPEIADPTGIDMELDITITANTSFSSIGQTQLDEDITLIVADYEKKLEILVDLALFEQAVEALSYVTIARVAVTNGAPVQADWDEYFSITATPIWS